MRLRRDVKVFSIGFALIFSSLRQFSTGSVVVTATCAMSPLSQITSKTKMEEKSGMRRSNVATRAPVNECVAPAEATLLQFIHKVGEFPVVARSMLVDAGGVLARLIE